MAAIAPSQLGSRLGMPLGGPRRMPTLPVRSQRRAVVVGANGKAPATPPPKVPETMKKQDLTTRGFRRTVYDFDLWTKHRSITRYTSNLVTIPSSRIIRSLSYPIGVVMAFSTFVGVYHTLLEGGILPSEVFPKLTLPTAEPQSLTSFALSLLLVFRTNSSYGRFDEARKIWGGILNRARNIANQAVTFIPADDQAGREAVGKWTVGFCQALRAHLQEDADLRAELAKCEPKWTKEEIEMLATAQHRPIKAISMLSELTNQLNITQFQAMQMQENVQFFYDALGGCERLLRTPIPVSYTRHTSRFLILWMSLLPLGLWDRYHWGMLPAIALIGFLLLGIDEIGVQIEEPFGILPLDVISKRAETDVNSLLKDNNKVVDYIADYRAGMIKPDPIPMFSDSDFDAATSVVAAVVAAPIAKPSSNGNGSNGNGNGYGSNGGPVYGIGSGSASGGIPVSASASASAAAPAASSGNSWSFQNPFASLSNPFAGSGSGGNSAAESAVKASAAAAAAVSLPSLSGLSLPNISLPNITLPSFSSPNKPMPSATQPASDTSTWSSEASSAFSEQDNGSDNGYKYSSSSSTSKFGISDEEFSFSSDVGLPSSYSSPADNDYTDSNGRSSSPRTRSWREEMDAASGGFGLSNGDADNEHSDDGATSEVDAEAAERFGRLASRSRSVGRPKTSSDWRDSV